CSRGMLQPISHAHFANHCHRDSEVLLSPTRIADAVMHLAETEVAVGGNARNHRGSFRCTNPILSARHGDELLDDCLLQCAARGSNSGLIDHQSGIPALRSPIRYVASNKALIFGAPKDPTAFN